VNKKVALLLLSIALVATVAAYVRTLPYQFVYDDTDQIVKNTAVHSWAFVPHYFASDVWPHASADEFSNYYRPVFQLWLLLNYKVFGLNPVWWHFTSLFVHLLVTSLVFLLALTLTRDELLAGGAAALFGLHPIHIEAVTDLRGNRTIDGCFLSGFFALLPQEFAQSRLELWNRPVVHWITGLLCRGPA